MQQTGPYIQNMQTTNTTQQTTHTTQQQKKQTTQLKNGQKT